VSGPRMLIMTPRFEIAVARLDSDERGSVPMRRIAVINQKGGVGKTTTTVTVAAALARWGYRVLLIDMDPQGHLTLHLGMDLTTSSPTTYDVLTRATPISQARRLVRDNLWCVGSHIELAAAEPELMGVVGREMILRDALDAEHDSYDYVLIDCPPSLGLLTLNALAAAWELFVPVQPHFLALQGLGNLLKTVSLVNQRINPSLKVNGVIVCMYEAGTRLATEVVNDLQAFLEQAGKASSPWAGARVFKTRIRRNIRLAECPSHGLTIFDYAAKSNGAVDYEMLAAEVAGRPVPYGDRSEVEDTGTAMTSNGSSVPAPVVPTESAMSAECAGAAPSSLESLPPEVDSASEEHAACSWAPGPGGAERATL